MAAGGNSSHAELALHDYGYGMSFHGELVAAVGKRVSLRLRNGDGFRDLLGVLQSEKSLIRKSGEVVEFSPDEIVLMKVVPLFNRRNEKFEALSIYETASKSLREITSEIVRIYSCGPTVYRDAHVGNMRTFLLTDILRRALKLRGQESISISNITDVGHMSENFTQNPPTDKVLEEAALENITAKEVAEKYEERFHRDLAILNITPATSYPRASDEINSMIASISELIEKGSAYIGSDGNVYFDARSFESYGFISGNKLDALQPGHRYEYQGDGGKKFHADWALWKVSAARDEMVWDSPWGRGFPGWHIECSAMSLRLLGDEIDIHVGGIDLRFPHHENERAQTNSLAGREVVGAWLHGEHLLFEGKKMSKSSGNVLLVSDLIDRGIDPLALRLALLENRYRSQFDLTWQVISAAESTLKRWREAIASWGVGEEVKFDKEIADYFMNDLDTPKAIVRLRAIEKDPTIGSQDKAGIFLFADQVLGLDLDRAPAEVEMSDEIAQLIAEREVARASGNWSESDRLRDRLIELGYTVRDGKI